MPMSIDLVQGNPWISVTYTTCTGTHTICLENVIYRVRTGSGNPGKSWNFRKSFSRPGKSWNSDTGPGKSWKLDLGKIFL